MPSLLPHPLLAGLFLGFTSLCALADDPAEWLPADPGTIALAANMQEVARVVWSENREGPVYLEFDAWIDARKVAGYRGAFRVFWNGQELESAEQRPAQAKFTIQDGREVPFFSRHGWTVPKGVNPEALESHDGVYRPLDALFKPWRFRFILPHTPPGRHEIRWESTVDGSEETLQIRNIRLTRQS